MKRTMLMVSCIFAVLCVLIISTTHAQFPSFPGLSGLPTLPTGGGTGGGGTPDLSGLNIPSIASVIGGNNNNNNAPPSPPPAPGSSSNTASTTTKPTTTPTTTTDDPNRIVTSQSNTATSNSNVVKSNVDMSVEGYWVVDPNNPCKTTSTCCCAKDVIQIKPGDSASSSTKVYGELAASGCNGFTTIESVFDKFLFLPVQTVNSTVVTWSIPVYGYQYRGQMSGDGNAIQVYRTDQKTTCINNFVRGMIDDGKPRDNAGTAPAGPTGQQDLTSDGKFSATEVPKTIVPTGQSSVTLSPDINHNVQVAFINTNSGASGANDSYQVTFTIQPLQSLFTSSVTPQWVTLHYLSPTSANPNVPVEANPNNRKMEGTALSWSFSSIRIPSGLAARLSFSYYTQSGTQYETDTIFFAPGGVAGSTGGGSTVPSTNTGTVAPTSTPGKWAGVYNVDGRCVPSSNCCCATGTITVEEIAGDSSKARITTTLDGSSTCNGMTNVSGDFSLESASKATYAYPDSPLTLIADMNGSFSELSFSNSIFDCKSYATRPTPAWSGSGGGSTSTPPPAAASGSIWDGTFKVDNRCVKSDKCCCAQGNIVAKQISSTQVTITSTLDGSSTCGNMNEVTGDFTLTSTTQAKYKHPEYPIDLIAEVSADGSQVSFKNSIYECLTYGMKVAGSNTAPTTYPPTSSSGGNTGGGDLRNQIVGMWDSNGKCKPTPNCCCLKGALEIMLPEVAQQLGHVIPTKYNAADPTLVFVVGKLDGGLACMRKKQLEGICELDYSTLTGKCSLEGIAFDAYITGNSLIIKNDMYLNCNSVAYKRSGDGNTAPGVVTTWGIALVVMAVTILLSVLV